MKLSAFVMTLLMIAGSKVFSQTEAGRLKGLGVPVAGSTLQLQYDPKGGPLEGKKEIYGLLYMYNNYQWRLDDLPLKAVNGVWQTSYTLPANCAFLAIKFVTEENNQVTAYDNNNDEGFVSTTVNKEGAKLPGGVLAWGVFRKPSLHKAPGGYFDKKEINNDAFEMWVRKEMETFPDNMPAFFDIYLQMLRLTKGSEFAEIAPRNLKKFIRIPGIKEKDYNTVYETYKYQLKDSTTADSLRKVILAKYPQGNAARFNRYMENFQLPMGEPKFAAMERFLRDFPVTALRKDSFATQSFIYYNTYRTLGQVYFAMGKYDSVVRLIPDMDFMTLNEIYHFNIEKAFVVGKLSLDKIYPLTTPLIDAMIKKVNDGSFMEGTRFSPRQAASIAQAHLDARLAAHIALLNKMKKYKEAWPYLAYLSPKGKYINANLNEAHVNILEHTGHSKMIKEVLEQSMLTNAATPAMLELLQKNYKKAHGNLDGFDAYLETLKKPEDVQQTKTDLKAKIVHVQYPLFKLKDMEGNTIDAADWKNRIIVLDYWATWCVPCKLSFPGMQLAVDKYRNDPAVGFYFIATMEKSKTWQQDIAKYIKSSGYRFHVLFDDTNPKTEENDRVFKSMTPIIGSSAIPQKVILKDGYIRYMAEGYNGSPTRLMDELSYVIDILKEEK
jgi:thiol-disulfide isomerase/thioredoxin